MSRLPRPGGSRRRARGGIGGAMAAMRGSGIGDEPINVTPLIDVVMVLIIFFLIVGNLAMEKRGGVDLPESAVGDRATARDRPVIVVVEPDGRVLVDGRSVPPADSGASVATLVAEDPARPVQLRAARSARYADVRPVMASLRDAGFAGVELATRDAGRGGAAPVTPRADAEEAPR